MSIVVRFHPKNVTIAQYEDVLRREEGTGASFHRTAGTTTSASELTETYT